MSFTFSLGFFLHRLATGELLRTMWNNHSYRISRNTPVGFRLKKSIILLVCTVLVFDVFYGSNSHKLYL